MTQFEQEVGREERGNGGRSERRGRERETRKEKARETGVLPGRAGWARPVPGRAGGGGWETRTAADGGDGFPSARGPTQI